MVSSGCTSGKIVPATLTLDDEEINALVEKLGHPEAMILEAQFVSLHGANEP
jgi:hypothetical protein